MWDFETDEEYQGVLSWVDEFVTKKVEPLDMVLGATKEYDDPDFIRQIRPLQKEVKERGLCLPPWARVGWAGIRPTETCTTQRNPRSIQVCAGSFWLSGSRYRQC